jgi:RimJ/RimL family protein N-acetyltransferase
MSDDQVQLRPVVEDDLLLLERFLLDPEATGPFQWRGWSDPTGWRRRWTENNLLTSEGGQLMVLSDGHRAGFVAWRKIDAWGSGFHWSLGAQLLPEARGRGIGTAAQRLLVTYLFTHTPVLRLEADTESDNVAEQRVLEKCGFTREGVMRGVLFRGGLWRDVARYGVLRGDLAAMDRPAAN